MVLFGGWYFEEILLCDLSVFFADVYEDSAPFVLYKIFFYEDKYRLMRARVEQTSPLLLLIDIQALE